MKQAEVLKEEYKKKRAEYFENNDPKILKALNQKRVAKGHNKLRNHRPASQEPRPLSAYFRCSCSLLPPLLVSDDHTIDLWLSSVILQKGATSEASPLPALQVNDGAQCQKKRKM